MLAVNPRDPQNLVAAAIVLGSGVAVYASLDGGRSWIRGGPASGAAPLFDGLDPAVAFDRDGSAYLLAAGEELAAWKSTDGGLTWSGPAVVPGSSWDRPWIACEAGSSETLRNRLYVAGKMPVTVFGHSASEIAAVSASKDGGATFSFPRLLLPAPEKALLNVVSDLVAAPAGPLILTLQTFAPQDPRAPLLAGSYQTIASSDGGRTFTEPRPGPPFHAFGHAREGKSLFGLGGARMAIDASPSRRGRLYLTWLDAGDGYYRVMAAASGDGGETWSLPVRVSDDATPTDRSTPAIAVNDQGVVGVSWYDRRADPADGCYQLFFAASVDGAVTFSASERIDSQQTCPLGRATKPRAAETDPIASEYRFKNGGDTQGLVALPGGAFGLAWIREASGEMQLWSTTVLVRADRLAARRRAP